MENKKLIKEYVKLCLVASQKANFMSMRAEALREHSAAIAGLPNEEKAVLNAYFNEIFDGTSNIQITTGKTLAEIEAAYPAQTAAIKKAHAEFRVIERVDAFVTDTLDSKSQGKGKIFAAVKAEIIDKGLSIADASINWDAINATFKPVQERYMASDRMQLETEIAAITENPDGLAFKTATASLATLHAAPIYTTAEIEDLTKLYLISKDALARYQILLADASTVSVATPAKTSKLMEELKKYVELLESKGLTQEKAKQLEADKFRAKSAAYPEVSKAFNEVGTIQNFHLLIGRIMGKEAGYYQANANQALQALEIETSKRIITELKSEKTKLSKLVEDFILIGKVTGSIMVDGADAPEVVSAHNSYSNLMYTSAPLTDAALVELKTVLGRTTSEITSHASGGTTAIATRPVNEDVLRLVEDLQHDNFLYSKINGGIDAASADPKELAAARTAYSYLRKATPFKRSKTKAERTAELETYVNSNFRVQTKKDDILDESRTLRPFVSGKGVKIVAGILAAVALAGAVGGVVADIMNADNFFTSKPADTQNAYADFTAALQEASVDGLTAEELANLRTTFYVAGDGLSEEQRTINFMLDNLAKGGESHTPDQIKTPADITYLTFIQAYADAAQDGLTAEELETLKTTYYVTGDNISAEQQTINSIIDGLSDGDAPVIENGVYTEFMESYAELSKDGLTVEEITELQEIIDATDDAEAKTAMQNILNSSVDSAYESFMTLYSTAITDDILTADELAGLQGVVDLTEDAVAKAALQSIMYEIQGESEASMYDQFMTAIATASADGISDAELEALRANYYREAGDGVSAEQLAINTVIESLDNQESHTPDQIKTADDAAITAFTKALNNAIPDGIDATEEASLESMIAASGASATAKAMMTTLLDATLDGDQTITVTIEKMPESLKSFVEADTIEAKTALYNAETDEAVKAVMEEMLEILNNQETHGPSDLITEADKDKIAGYEYMNQEFSEDLNNFIAEWNELLADNGGTLDFTDADTLTAINNLKGKYSSNDKIDEYGVSSTEMIQRIIDNQRALQSASGSAESTSDAFVSDFGGYVADGELSAEDVKALRDAYYTEGTGLTAEQQSLNDMIEVLEGTVQLQENVDSMQSSIEALESANDALEKENSDLEAQKAKLESDLATYKTNYSNLQNSYNQLSEQYEALQAKYDSLVASGSASAAELESVKAQLATVQGQLASAQSTLATAESNLASLYTALGYDYTSGMSMGDMFSDIFFDLGIDYKEDTSENNKDNPSFGK